MNDKTIRRRRAVLALLVVLSLILLTAYFGESPGGGLHSIQRGFLTIVSPIQDGANKALKPVRGAIGWVGDTLNAKGERNRLRTEVDRLTHKLDKHEGDERSYRELAKMYDLDNRLSINDYKPVSAGVVYQPSNIWHSTVIIDEGESAGIRVEDAVMNEEGLVGKVTEVGSQAAQVSLLTDSTVGVSAEIAATGATGLAEAKVGDPNDLLIRYLPSDAQVTVGQQVVTSGLVSGTDESLYPPGIPIGQVTSIDEESPYLSVNVRPVVNFGDLEEVQVLTDVKGGRAATLQRLVGTLEPGGSNKAGGSEGSSDTQLASTGEGG